MSFIDKLVRSKGYKNFMSKLYGWGAAVVIIGALFKINHWPGGTEMLIIGMGTETVIFFLSAFEPQHVEWNWSLVYPQLSGMAANPIEDGKKAESETETTKSNEPAVDPLTKQLDKMLAEANITPDLVDRLGRGMENLAESAQSMNNMSTAAAATDSFVSNMDQAAKAASQLQSSMQGAPEAVTTLTNIYKETAQALSGTGESSYVEQMKQMATSLASINAMYEMQIKDSTTQFVATKEVAERMQTMVANFEESAASVLRYREQVDALSRKVSELNDVYGKMLAAMQTRV